MESPTNFDYAMNFPYDMMTSHLSTSPVDQGYASMTSEDSNSTYCGSVSPTNEVCYMSDTWNYPSYPLPEFSTSIPAPTYITEPNFNGFHQSHEQNYLFPSNNTLITSPISPPLQDTFTPYQPNFISPNDIIYQTYNQMTHSSCGEPKPKRKRVQTVPQRKAANVRERKRMCSVNTAFDVLKKRVPTFSYEKRLSRIETLKLAIDYIAFMTDVLNGENPDDVRLSRYASAAKLINSQSSSSETDIL